MQIEVDTIFREAQEKRKKRSADERQMHDAMLVAIFKAIHEDSVPESYVGIIPPAGKTEWDVMSPRSSSSGHFQTKSRMTDAR